jgi:hypothetical protein
MRAVGFGDPLEILGETKNVQSRTVVTLRVINGKTQITRLPVSVLQSLQGYRQEIEQEISHLEGAPSVSIAIKEMRDVCSSEEIRTALETSVTIIRNILSNPTDIRMFRVKKNNPSFNRMLGRLPGSASLMRAIGFIGYDNETDQAAFVLKSHGAGFDLGTANTTSTANFKFPSLDAETEKFLYRRKVDLEVALRTIENLNASKGPLSSTKSLTKSFSTIQGSTSLDNGAKTGIPGKARRKLGTKAKEEFATPDSLGLFLSNASPAQRAQIVMIQNVFHIMDVDKGTGILLSTIYNTFDSLFGTRWRFICQRCKKLLPKYRARRK